jgi:hypothetical protein
MSLQDRLRSDLKDAMRARDSHRKSALRMVLTGIQLAEVEAGHELEDVDIVELIRKEVKRREEALELMRDAGRDDLVEGEVTEVDILKAYLPKQMSEDEIRELAQEVIADVNAESMSDLGAVMGTIMPRVKGKAEGRTVNRIVRELLAS